MVRIQLEISEEDRERFARQARMEGMLLDAWLVKVARQRVETPRPDKQERFKSRDWEEHRRNMDETIREVIPVGEPAFDETAQSILEIFDEINQSMPEDAFNEFPADGAANLKHYLYGWPKEDEG